MKHMTEFTSAGRTDGHGARSGRWRRRVAGAAIAAASLVGSAWVATPTAQANFDLKYRDIPAHDFESDGVIIEAAVWTPETPGPHPIILMPSSWGSLLWQYSGSGARLAADGYVVIAYTARGWAGEESGEIDIAGPDTIQDVTTLIDWAVANEDGDPEQVGMVGVSYGAGIGLLAAGSESEDRIDAVVALSTWGDLEAALYPNETINAAATEALLGLAFLDPIIIDPLANAGPELIAINEEYEQGELTTGLEIAPSRSPINVVDRLNERGVAVMLGNAWSDSVFPPSGVVEMFEELSGPRKLALAPGDHGGPELGALGIPTERLNLAFDWLDRYVAMDTSVNVGDNVEVVTNDADRIEFGAASFDELSNTPTTYNLTNPVSPRYGWWPFYWYGPKHGELQGRSGGTWSTAINGGLPSTADSMLPVGNALLSGYIHDFVRIPPLLIPSTLDRSRAVVWETGRLWHQPTIAGSPTLDITVRPDRADTTFVVYLYEKNLAEVAALVTHKAYTVRDARPGRDVELSIELEPTAWELERGSRLYMVIDTVDPRYDSLTTGGTVQFRSTGGHAAQLTIPFR